MREPPGAGVSRRAQTWAAGREPGAGAPGCERTCPAAPGRRRKSARARLRTRGAGIGRRSARVAPRLAGGGRRSAGLGGRVVTRPLGLEPLAAALGVALDVLLAGPCHP